MKLRPCFYGDRRVIYVQITHPDAKNGQKSLSVYGHTLDAVWLAVDRGLSEAFGKTASNRPSGRPKGRKNRKSR